MAFQKFLVLLSLATIISATYKPVLLRDNSTNQLYTSSLLTWETFNNDLNQLKSAVFAGTFIGGEEVSDFKCRCCFHYTIHITSFITELQGLCLSFNN